MAPLRRACGTGLAPGPGRRRVHAAAQLFGAREALEPRPDDPRPRGEWTGAGVAWPKLWPLADVRADPAGNAGGDDLDRGPSLPQPSRRRPDRDRTRNCFGPDPQPSHQRDVDDYSTACP